MYPELKPPGTEHLKLKHYTLLSTYAFKFDLRRYNKAASVPAAGVVTLNRGVIFAGRADGTAAPIPTVAVTFPVSALISCDAADAASAEVTGSILSYEISDYMYLKDVVVTGRCFHSSTFQLSLSRFCNTTHLKHPLIPPNTSWLPLKQSLHAPLNLSHRMP